MPNKTAAQAYAANQATCRELLKRLERALDGHAERAALDQLNWGYSGDLGPVAQGLLLGLSMLGGLTAAERQQHPEL
ncbi:MAG: hypothetical protein LCH79_07810 [Proteobacteria bacterium]|nr:hypothetical protein [Pseudomonadota bacterium]